MDIFKFSISWFLNKFWRNTLFIAGTIWVRPLFLFSPKKLQAVPPGTIRVQLISYNRRNRVHRKTKNWLLSALYYLVSSFIFTRYFAAKTNLLKIHFFRANTYYNSSLMWDCLNFRAKNASERSFKPFDSNSSKVKRRANCKANSNRYDIWIFAPKLFKKLFPGNSNSNQ